MSQLNGSEPAQARSTLPESNPSPLARRALDAESRFLPSQCFIISCGTVTLDRKAGKVLLVYNKPNGIYQLPKGRKDIDEDGLLSIAIRETLEETGYEVKPLILKIPTRSTPVHAAGTPNGTTNGTTNGMAKTAATVPMPAPNDGFVDLDGEKVPEKGLALGIPNREAIACLHWYDAQTKALKMIFHFAAEADSTKKPRAQRPEDAAKHGVYWVEYEDALERLWYEEERMAVEKALCDLRRSEDGDATPVTGV
ncbi:NUDIX domain-containing protein [Plectosphaerella plurivora]|uniref:NUDIX domain-containing protein n=1 Tax=Plectosphaerella plurivora TaxID=936078 RepID=A0A9P8VLM3_9PEZI|nr:NUDIX domain-containing protein [Plectosphaerella plurivora]